MALALSPLLAEAGARRVFRLSAERRNVPRVKIEVGGRFMRPDRTEHAATTIDASIRHLGIQTDATCELGERIIGYFETVGRVEGTVERLFDGGFVLEMASTARKRDKLASQLTWLANREMLNLPEDRRHDRIVPRDPRVLVRRAAGIVEPINAHLIDVSRSGAGVSVPGHFTRGEEIMVGTTPARVVRAFDGGVAVEFRAPIPEAMFSREIRL